MKYYIKCPSIDGSEEDGEEVSKDDGEISKDDLLNDEEGEIDGGKEEVEIENNKDNEDNDEEIVEEEEDTFIFTMGIANNNELESSGLI